MGGTRPARPVSPLMGGFGLRENRGTQELHMDSYTPCPTQKKGEETPAIKKEST